MGVDCHAELLMSQPIVRRGSTTCERIKRTIEWSPVTTGVGLLAHKVNDIFRGFPCGLLGSAEYGPGFVRPRRV